MPRTDTTQRGAPARGRHLGINSVAIVSAAPELLTNLEPGTLVFDPTSASKGLSVVYASANITLDLANDIVNCDATAGDFTVTLPDVVQGFVKIYSVVKLTSANKVTIVPQPGEFVRGAATLDLITADDSALLQNEELNLNWRSR